MHEMTAPSLQTVSIALLVFVLGTIEVGAGTIEAECRAKGFLEGSSVFQQCVTFLREFNDGANSGSQSPEEYQLQIERERLRVLQEIEQERLRVMQEEAARQRLLDFSVKMLQGNSAPPPQSGILCVQRSTYLSGANRICMYRCGGSDYALTLRAVDICPVTFQGP